ncbi:MAG: hypothetical protein M1833_002719 [Piccolia ochrophora]|nr:MAG: hypothetical protein M1833_002719 [Piccolia ochrophora]
MNPLSRRRNGRTKKPKPRITTLGPWGVPSTRFIPLLFYSILVLSIAELALGIAHDIAIERSLDLQAEQPIYWPRTLLVAFYTVLLPLLSTLHAAITLPLYFTFRLPPHSTLLISAFAAAAWTAQIVMWADCGLRAPGPGWCPEEWGTKGNEEPLGIVRPRVALAGVVVLGYVGVVAAVGGWVRGMPRVGNRKARRGRRGRRKGRDSEREEAGRFSAWSAEMEELN